MPDAEDLVRDAFPEIELLESDELAAAVVDAWADSVAETGVDDLESVPWYPPVQDRLELPDETLPSHVRDVVSGAVALAEVLVDRRGTPLSLETVIAGALVHDVSKLYEFDGRTETDVHELLGHPHFGVHVAARAGLPVEIQHIVLAHSAQSAVEPATLEAEIVRLADVAAASAIRATASTGPFSTTSR